MTQPHTSPPSCGFCTFTSNVPVRRVAVALIDTKTRRLVTAYVSPTAYARLKELARRSKLHACVTTEQRKRWNKLKKQRRARTGRK